MTIDFIYFTDDILLMAIFQCNSFTLREYDKLRGKELGSAVFPTIARINHSCVPNTVLSYNLETRECEVIIINLTTLSASFYKVH